MKIIEPSVELLYITPNAPIGFVLAHECPPIFGAYAPESLCK